MNVLEVAREYFPDASDDELDHCIWTHTGFPGFWTGDPETCFREQLSKLKTVLDNNQIPCEMCTDPVENSSDKYTCNKCVQILDDMRINNLVDDATHRHRIRGLKEKTTSIIQRIRVIDYRHVFDYINQNFANPSSEIQQITDWCKEKIDKIAEKPQKD